MVISVVLKKDKSRSMIAIIDGTSTDIIKIDGRYKCARSSPRLAIRRLAQGRPGKQF